MRRIVDGLADGWNLIQRYAAALILIAMTALYGFNVLMRAIFPQFASALAWIDEGARYMMVWVVFLGAGLALEVGRHVLIDLMWARWSARARRIVFAAIDVTGFAFCVFMLVLAIRMTAFIASTGQISPTLGLPTYVLYMAPVVGFASLSFVYLLRLFSMRDARRTPVKTEWLGNGP